jgi:hypothetical protein
MAIALGTRPEDNAKMVCSRGCIAYLPLTFETGKAIPKRGHCATHNFRSIFTAASYAAIR